ncbi:uncharacterized protein LOC106174943 [Lingula anatina]|uniref:Uncharacterized protein LOC106174943 n=1 Tax=Lingula anatina TaxID=7574 RepID=A0A1S3JP91_LINAN|nr:uncharacterized protein LOC106174943 [Lingula anatina]|eukprot:XP_013412178.1 uncharacterized protein LOC106174943 [Lingula anatina]
MLKTHYQSSASYRTYGSMRLPFLGQTVKAGQCVSPRAILTKDSASYMVHRSVPPNMESVYADMYSGATSPARHRAAPVSMSSSAEYATRFKSRPTTTPKVVGFDPSTVVPREKSGIRGVNGFFPPVKLRGAGFRSRGHYETQSQPGGLELIPVMSPDPSEIRPKTEQSPRPELKTEVSSIIFTGGRSRSVSSKPRTKMDTVQQMKMMHHVHNPDYISCPLEVEQDETLDDLSYLPKPRKQLIPTKDVPFVYRYKVKKNMNKLNHMMASRAPVFPEHIW